MALTPVGVQFVSADFTKFLNNMSKAALSIANLGNVSKNRLAAIQSFATALTKVGDSAQKMANANAKIVTSNNQVILSNNKLTTSVNQVALANSKAAIAASHSASSQASSQARVSLSMNKTATELQRLSLIKKVTNLFASGRISADEFALSLSGINNKASKLISTASTLLPRLQSLTTSLLGLAAISNKGIMSGVAGAGGFGGILGGILGSIVPGLGTIVGKTVGTLAGMWYKLQMNFFNAIGTFLPKIVAKILGAGVTIGKAVFDFGKTIISSIGKVLSAILSPIKGLFSAIFGAFTGGTGGGWKSLGGTIFSSMFKFEVLKQVIRGVISEIKMLAKESFSAAVGLQTLTIRLDNLIAMQIRSAKGIDDYGTSIKMASGYTQNLLRWIQKLALATPISVEDISRTVSLSLAMGWTVQSTKELTKAIIDYTATLGMGSEISERIIYNFAQMKQQGKVTGTELRDLGRGAFMPINTILRIMYDSLDLVADGMDKTTISFADFTQQASEGTIPVEKFFDSFVKFVGTAMPDAAYRMNYTFEAVRQNLSDLFGVLLGWNVLGPMIKSITKPLQDFIEMLSTDEALANANAIGKAIAFMVDSVRTGFSLIGKSLGQFFQAMGVGNISIENVVISLIKFGMAIRAALAGIGKFIQTLIPFAQRIHSVIGSTLDDMGGATVRNINDTRDKANKTFKEMSGDFFTWGANIVISFAEGMITGAASAITAAINYIANLLTSWFVVHSPPRILPDIDKWGMETINEWLHGFTQADFSILSDMQSVIKDALGALVNLGMMTDVQSSEEYLSISLDLIKAMDELNRTGTISASIFERLAEIGGVFGQEISELLQLQLQYADATRIAEQAQIDFDNAVKATQVASGKSNRLIREYNKLLRGGANKSALKDKLKFVNLARIELDVARKAEEEKKTALDVAQANLKAIQESIELQKSLIKAMTDLAQAQKDAATEASGGAGAVEDLTEAVKDLSDTFGGVGGGLEIDFDALKNKAAKGFQDIFDDMKKRLGLAWSTSFTDPTSGFQVALSNLKIAFAATIVDLKSAWDAFATAVQLPSWDEISRAWNAPVPGGGGPGRGRDKEQTNSKTLLQKFKDVIEAFVTSVENGEGGVGGLLGRIATYVWDKLSTWISDKWEIYKPIITQKLADAIDTITKGLEGGTSILATALGNMASAIGKLMWDKFVEYIKSKFTLKAIWDTIIANNPIAYTIDIGKWLLGGIDESWAPIITLPTINYSAGKDEIDTYNQLGADIAGGIQSGVESSDTTWWQTWLDAFNEVAEGLFESGSDSQYYKRMGNDIVNGLKTGIVEQILAIKWNDIWQVIVDGFKLLFGIGSESTVFNGFGLDIINGLKTGIVDTINNIIGPEGALTIAFKNVITAIKGFFGIGKRMDENPFYLIGKSIIDGIVAGLNAFVGTLQSKIAEIAALMPAWMRELIGADSPSMVFSDIGRDMMLGLAEGILGASKIVNRAISKNIGSNASQKYTMQSPMSASPVYGGTNVTFGDVHLSGNMDFAVFESMFNKMVLKR